MARQPRVARRRRAPAARTPPPLLRNPLLWGGAALAVAVVAALVAVSLARGSDDGGSGAPSLAGVPAARFQGDAAAPLVVQLWEDFQCPACKLFSEEVKPLIVREFVETGQVRLVFRHKAFLGEESLLAAEASECAGEQGKFWEYHDLLFASQGAENSGAFVPERLKALAEEAGLDRESFDACLDSGQYRQAIQAESDSAEGVRATPTLFIGDEKVEGLESYPVLLERMREQLGR